MGYSASEAKKEGGTMGGQQEIIIIATKNPANSDRVLDSVFCVDDVWLS